MKISVCMAAHNGERFIREQIVSILCQLGSDDELVISDDSSTDSTCDILKAMPDPRIRLLEGNTFYSPIFNFENALRHASGEIIILSDQDDIWLPNKVNVIREYFAAEESQVCLLVLDAEVIDAQGAVLAPSVLKKFRRFGPGLLNNLIDNSYIGCCMAFTRELLPYSLPFPRRIPMHDVWLGLIAELFGRTEFLPVKTMQYRKHDASTTAFRIKFQPWTQVKRRFFLLLELANRYRKFAWTARTRKHI